MTGYLQNFPLQNLNTFGICANALWYGAAESPEEMIYLLKNKPSPGLPVLILGGGSNVLFLRDYPGIVLQNQIRFIKTEHSPKKNKILVYAGAGVAWNDLVNYCVDAGYGGIENLALIPGTCGAAPMQNIGAYGVELKDIFYSLEALNLNTFETETFSKDDCKFAYRSSIFKQAAKGLYVILSITLELSTQNHILNTSYGAIQSELNSQGILQPDIRNIREVVVSIRKSKLPDPAIIGNAGSFFKNPEISDEKFTELIRQHPGIISYPTKPGYKKLAAGWLIEQAGWKGYRKADAGVHPLQALVLVNYGNASGSEIEALSKEIQDSVLKKFDIELEAEVNVIRD